MTDFNICLATDSYKIWHWKAYMPNTENNYGYLEARKGAQFKRTVFFGLQYILKKYLQGRVVTKEKIDEAEAMMNEHMGKGFFNREGWEHILNNYGGKLPVTISAVPEGTAVPEGNILMSVELTRNDPKLCWLTNFLESLLLHVWYPSTVAAQALAIKEVLKFYADKTGDSRNLDFKMQDFGFRGVSSYESAQIGGAAYMLFFQGSDNVPALQIPKEYYAFRGMPAYSVAATEHSIMTSRGEEGEWEVLEHILDIEKSGVLSLVIDSYDYERFITTCGTKYQDKILNRDGVTVFRPDSGEPITTILRCLELLDEYFGSHKNTKDYKVLNDKVRLLWGDGIDYTDIDPILRAMKEHGWSIDCMACFGMGGGLLQKVNRDTQRMAFKSSAQFYDGAWHDVWKKPKDASKASKRGRLQLVRDAEGNLTTVREEDAVNGLLRVVFQDGELKNEQTWEQIRGRAAEAL